MIVMPGMMVRVPTGPMANRHPRRVLAVRSDGVVVLEGNASSGDGSTVLTHVRFLSLESLHERSDRFVPQRRQERRHQ